MEKITLGYSTKNIPIHSKDKYMKSLVSKTEDFLRRLRWKAFFFENEDHVKKEHYGFKTPHTPPQDDDLIEFENDMYELMKSIEFKYSKNKFQNKVSDDLKKIRKSGKVAVPADKTTNLYLLNRSEYEKLLRDNVTKTYKKAEPDREKDINKTSAKLAHTLEIDDRVQQFTTQQCFITLKDHKSNFRNNPQCRLINPAKNELGKISKKITDDKITEILSSINTSLNLWKNTAQVIEWFNTSPKGEKSRFIQFDIVEFYPSITEQLLDKAIDFASQYTTISEQDINIIKHAKNSLLFHHGTGWEKKDRTFDVTMGSYDGAETCELVGLYMLHQLQQIMPPHLIGLYRDDGLAMIPAANGPKMDKLRKQIGSVFKKEGLKITVTTNLVEVNFLDVTLNAVNGRYCPYRKPNDHPLYINAQSNHPPNIIKQLPKMITKRLSDISCDAEEFNKAKGAYEQALRSSGYDEKMEYIEKTSNPADSKVRRKRTRNIIWYNPPYSLNVTTNIGKKFLWLLAKHFPRGHRLNKIFNKNTVKLSYSCLPNVSTILNSTRSQRTVEEKEDRMCNCRNKAKCPISGECLKTAVVYEATLQTEETQYQYIGLTEHTFKARYNAHKSSFNNENQRLSTELSKKVWELKEQHVPYNLKWTILRHGQPYRGGMRACDLCLTEKLCILTSKHENLLNKRREILNKCRHMNKLLLKKCL